VRISPDAPAEPALLEGPVIQALLASLGGHALILDAELRLRAADPGAAADLGLAAGPGGTDILPVLARTQFASRGYQLCGAPLPIGQGLHIWILRDIRARERREELEMVYLHLLLGALGGAPGHGASWSRKAWEVALDLYRDVVAPRLGEEHPREAPGARAAEAGEIATEDGPESEPVEAGAPTVLVADDSPVLRRLLKAILGKDYRVLTAADGAEALAAARTHGPDLILLDVLMPVMDGFAACVQLKADPRTRDIPVLFLTALQGEADEVRGLDAGAVDFIQKPLNAATVAARVRTHLGLRRAREELKILAAEDALTGLANRRRFDQLLAQEWQRGAREGKPLSLILGDVDAFKAYNDAYGHVAGDGCLKAVAAVFRGAMRRPADLAARFGGEEFICLLPETDEAGARVLAEGLTSALASQAIPHAHSEVADRVTVSLGVATAIPVLGGRAWDLVEEADRRMYRAKRLAKAKVPPAQE